MTHSKAVSFINSEQCLSTWLSRVIPVEDFKNTDTCPAPTSPLDSDLIVCIFKVLPHTTLRHVAAFSYEHGCHDNDYKVRGKRASNGI